LTDAIIYLLFNLLEFHVEDVAVVFVIFEPLDNILAMRAVDSEGIGVRVLFAVARYVVLVQLHDFFVQLVVQLSGHNRVTLVQTVLLDELADETSARRYLTLGSSHQELQDMIIRLLVMLTVILQNHEVADQWYNAWEVRCGLAFQNLIDVQLLIFWLECILVTLTRFEVVELLERSLRSIVNIKVGLFNTVYVEPEFLI
jgi:hypothetical protein